MEYIFGALIIIVSILLIIFVIGFIMFLFKNFIISRILSAFFSIVAVIVAFCYGEHVSEVWPFMLILTTLAWLFCIGPTVFDVEWDGTYDIDWERGTATKHETGGFFGNAVSCALVCGISYIIFGASPLVFFFFPIGILVLNGIIFLIAKSKV